MPPKLSRSTWSALAHELLQARTQTLGTTVTYRAVPAAFLYPGLDPDPAAFKRQRAPPVLGSLASGTSLDVEARGPMIVITRFP